MFFWALLPLFSNVALQQRVLAIFFSDDSIRLLDLVCSFFFLLSPPPLLLSNVAPQRRILACFLRGVRRIASVC